jgi:hypothetical protein
VNFRFRGGALNPAVSSCAAVSSLNTYGGPTCRFLCHMSHQPISVKAPPRRNKR